MSLQPPTSDSSTLPRYQIVDPRGQTPAKAGKSQERLQRSVRVLTWVLLAVCLVLWAIVGFFFWVPLLLRSTLRFTLVLIDSMLQGVHPLEAGRVLRDTVDFYRRGFLVAIEAVFGDLPEPVKAQRLMPAHSIVKEIGWSLLVWYAVLLATGMVDTTPVDLWRGVAEYPWRELFADIQGAAAGASGAVPADGVSP